MDTPQDYIKNTVVKCRARSTLYHTRATKWSRVHWGTGIVNGIVAATISLLSFVAESQGWRRNEVGMIGGLLLTISTSVITAIKAGQKQDTNEKAGDAYRTLEDKIMARFSIVQGEEELLALHTYCNEKMTNYTNKYKEPPPKECIPLEEKIREELFPVPQV